MFADAMVCSVSKHESCAGMKQRGTLLTQALHKATSAMRLRAHLAGKVLAQAVAVVEGRKVLRRAAAPGRLTHRRARRALGAGQRDRARRQLRHRRRGRDRLACTSTMDCIGKHVISVSNGKQLQSWPPRNYHPLPGPGRLPARMHPQAAAAAQDPASLLSLAPELLIYYIRLFIFSCFAVTTSHVVFKIRGALGGAPEAEKQWCSGDRYAFSCTVDRLDVRHLLRQYSNTLPQRPVSGLRPARLHVWGAHVAHAELISTEILVQVQMGD